MHPEDRYILSNLLSDAKITNDIWFAVDQGFIPSSDMSQIMDTPNYEDLLVGLFNEWYNEKANPEQQLLADLNGYLHLNDQFDDLKTIMSLSISDGMENYHLEDSENPEQDSEIKMIPVENTVIDNIKAELTEKEPEVINLSQLCLDNPMKILMAEELKENFPIRTEKDLDNNTNIVYIMNYSKRENWKDLVNGIFFRLRNNNYKGVSVQGAMDWLIHYHEIQRAKDIAFTQELCDGEAWMDEKLPENDLTRKQDRRSFIAKKLNIKKSKEEGYAKKAIKRGLKLLANFIPTEDINLFTSNDGFLVEANLFNYRFRKGHTSIISHTLNPVSYHIPYDLIVLNKDNVELANMCMYFDETPMIDQIVSTILYIKSGNEKEILSTGNFYNKRPEFYKDPLIRKDFRTELDLTEENEINCFLETENKKEEYDQELFEKIQDSVFKALPTFLGLELPDFVYREFSNITFDSFFDRYAREGEIDAPNLSATFPIQIKIEIENQDVI